MADKKISQLTSATTPLAGTEVLPIVQSSSTVKTTVESVFTATQPSGNANGIVYLNGSKQATTATKFFYNGTNMGVNTTSVTAIYGKTAQFGDGTSNNTLYLVGSSGTGFVANDGSIFKFVGRSNTTLSFGTNDVERIAVDLSGNTTLSTGNLVQGTAAKGVNFTANTPAAGMTSRLLNWYEEGTFTPVVAGSSTAGTATYSLQNGRYTRIGRQVYIEVALSWSGGTGTGNFYVTGLPFTSANGGTISGMTLALADFVATTANNVLTAFVPSNTSRVELWQYPTGGGAANNVAYDALAALYFSGSYTV